MSREEMRHCARCGSITLHEVITNNEITAVLCHDCLMRWANDSEVKKERKDRRTKSFERSVSCQQKQSK
jgi:hypothetical protein